MERKEKLIIASLFHDIGKLVYKVYSGDNHSNLGVDFLKNECKIEDPDILDCVKYHHGDKLRSGNIENDSLAYIVYIADNISAKADRRSKEKSDEIYNFKKFVPLYSVFNILNDNNKNYKYRQRFLNNQKGINYPISEDIEYDVTYYREILDQIKDKLYHLEFNKAYLDSLLSLLEGYLTYVPSSTNDRDYVDISLYDHMKLTAAMGACIYDYLEENSIKDYRFLLKDSKSFYEKEIFYLYSLDFSGIQDFIYQIVEENALKSLRTRSFYLEVLMEVIIDDILEKLNLSRANLLYSGGGGAYLILPNTEKVKNALEEIVGDINFWFREYFGIDLYLSSGGSSFSANYLDGDNGKLYRDIFSNATKDVSKKKLHRYSLDEIEELNNSNKKYGERECKICKRVDRLVDNKDICSICDDIIKFSTRIINLDFFSVEKKENQNISLDLPFDRVLVPHTKESLRKVMMEDRYIRSYSKNNIYIGEKLTTNLWIGDYSYDSELSSLVDEGEGIRRLALLRADVDNLGTSFRDGFNNETISLTRSSTFSRHMSIFFKYDINYILENIGEKRKVLIIYSGGDDLLLVGQWKDVIGARIDIREAFKKYTIGSLTLSCGIGLYNATYPIKRMALEVGNLEDKAKSNMDKFSGKEKDSICIFNEDLVFSWDRFIENVMGEKFVLIKEYMSKNKDRGITFLYSIVNLLDISYKDQESKLNIARLYYLLTRLKPNNSNLLDLHREFSEKITRWAQDDYEKLELIAAIYIYVYEERGRNGNK